MKAEMCLIIKASDLEEALRLQYGEGFMEDIDFNISSFLFDTEYINDVYKRYYFDTLEKYTGMPWQDENHIRIENCIKTYLQDTFRSFPINNNVLIDVSW